MSDQSEGAEAPGRPELPSNWGRWGADDEAGTLNLIDDAARARAAAEVRSGRFVSLALASRSGALAAGPAAAGSPGPNDGVLHVPQFTLTPAIAFAEALMITTHHPRHTHVDAVGHTVTDDKVYPGIPASEASSSVGLTRGTTTAVAGGVVTRGLLLDLAPGSRIEPGHPVTGADLDAACRRAGVEPQPGDAVVVRTGWRESPRTGEPSPGMSLDGVRWLHRNDIAIFIGDTGDAHPTVEPGIRAPLHTVGLARVGLTLVDAADPDELAQTCRELGRYSFLLVLAPPRYPGLSGLPVNPLALF